VKSERKHNEKKKNILKNAIIMCGAVHMRVIQNWTFVN